MFMNMLGGYSAPAFVMISGMGAWFFMRRQGSSLPIFRRGLALLAAAYLLNFIAPVWFKPASWYVLHLIGAMMLCAPLLKKMPRKAMPVLVFALLAAALFAQLYFKVPLHSGNTKMNDMSQPGGALRVALVSGHFPLLPWSALYVLGFYLAPLVDSKKKRALYLCSALCFSFMGLLGLLSLLIPRRQGVLERLLYIPGSFYPMMPIMFFLLTGAVVLTVALARGSELRHPIKPSNPLVSFGKMSLTAFIVHVFVFKQLLSLTPYYRKIPFVPAFVLAYAVIALFLLAAQYWKKVQFRYSFEWLLRKVS